MTKKHKIMKTVKAAVLWLFSVLVFIPLIIILFQTGHHHILPMDEDLMASCLFPIFNPCDNIRIFIFNRVNYNSKIYSHGYIGTYHSEESRGVYHFTFNEKNGQMTEPELFYETENAKWVTKNGGLLVFSMRKEGHAGTCFLRLRDGKADYAYEVLEERTAPCYILQEGEFVCTANYHEGTVMVYSVKDKKPDIVARIENGWDCWGPLMYPVKMSI